MDQIRSWDLPKITTALIIRLFVLTIFHWLSGVVLTFRFIILIYILLVGLCFGLKGSNEIWDYVPLSRGKEIKRRPYGGHCVCLKTVFGVQDMNSNHELPHHRFLSPIKLCQCQKQLHIRPKWRKHPWTCSVNIICYKPVVAYENFCILPWKLCVITETIS